MPVTGGGGHRTVASQASSSARSSPGPSSVRASAASVRARLACRLAAHSARAYVNRRRPIADASTPRPDAPMRATSAAIASRPASAASACPSPSWPCRCRIAALAETAHEPPTPLQRRVAQLGRYAIAGALGLALVVLAVGLARGIVVFARVNPEHKLRIVTAYQRRGNPAMQPIVAEVDARLRRALAAV